MAIITLADLLELNDKNSDNNGASDEISVANFLRILPAIPSSLGPTHQWLKNDGAPVVGFRAANVGLVPTSGSQSLVTATLNILGGAVLADVALAKAFKAGPAGLMTRESARFLEAALYAYEKQIFNGTVGGSASGFLGLANAMPYRDSTNVYNVGGTTAGTASSVYVVRVGPSGLQAVAGGALEVGAMYEGVRTDPADITKVIPVYGTNVSAYVGLQNADSYSAVRICNITADSGKTLTDDIISEALAMFPSDRPATHIIMNRRSLKQLKQSRTATSPTGQTAPTPQDSDSVPIVVVETITSTEALLGATP